MSVYCVECTGTGRVGLSDCPYCKGTGVIQILSTTQPTADRELSAARERDYQRLGADHLALNDAYKALQDEHTDLIHMTDVLAKVLRLVDPFIETGIRYKPGDDDSIRPVFRCSVCRHEAPHHEDNCLYVAALAQHAAGKERR